MRLWLGKCLATAALVVLLGAVVGQLPFAGAQDKTRTTKKTPPKKKPIANTEALDTRVSQAEEAFLRETETLAGEYFDAGHLDKAEALLKKIEALDASRPGVKEKLKFISDTQLTANEIVVDVDAGGSWQPARVMVFKDQPIRLEVSGTYRFVVNTVIGPEGFANDNPDVTMVGNARCGALVGVIVGEGQGGRKSRTTFAIGNGSESFKPPATGILFLRVNAPPEAKSTGKLKVTLSGDLKSAM